MVSVFLREKKYEITKHRGKGKQSLKKKKKVQKMSRFKGFDQDWLLRKGNDLNPTDRYFFPNIWCFQHAVLECDVRYIVNLAMTADQNCDYLLEK